MRKQLNEDEAMHITGVIPVAKLNHLPINYKKYKKDSDGCLEFRTKIEFKDNSTMVAVYHQWETDFKEATENQELEDLTWIPSWYEFYYCNKENK
jgi:hypothetical protein